MKQGYLGSILLSGIFTVVGCGEVHKPSKYMHGDHYKFENDNKLGIYYIQEDQGVFEFLEDGELSAKVVVDGILLDDAKIVIDNFIHNGEISFQEGLDFHGYFQCKEDRVAIYRTVGRRDRGFFLKNGEQEAFATRENLEDYKAIKAIKDFIETSSIPTVADMKAIPEPQ